ncbi:hypothetical protein PMAYCL1PPCAC_17166, partial [Pristionchus mayeri]
PFPGCGCLFRQGAVRRRQWEAHVWESTTRRRKGPTHRLKPFVQKWQTYSCHYGQQWKLQSIRNYLSLGPKLPSPNRHPPQMQQEGMARIESDLQAQECLQYSFQLRCSVRNCSKMVRFVDESGGEHQGRDHPVHAINNPN